MAAESDKYCLAGNRMSRFEDLAWRHAAPAMFVTSVYQSGAVTSSWREG